MNPKYLFFAILSLVFYALSKDIPFFWDNVLLVSKMGSHFYFNSFSWPLPENIDPAHPPFISFLNAVFWSVLGRELWVSHLVQLPFAFLFFIGLWDFIHRFVDQKTNAAITFAAVVLSAQTLSQLFLVSHEIMHLAMFFTALNALLNRKFAVFHLSLILLSLVSYRGMIMALSLFTFDVFDNYLKFGKFDLKRLKYYFISAIPALIYIFAHYHFTSWIYSSPNSQWKDLVGFVNLKGLLFNSVVLTHRLSDFGLIAFWIAAFYYFAKNRFLDQRANRLILLLFSSLIWISAISLLSKNTMGHRYFISGLIFLIIYVFYCVFKSNKKVKLISSVLIFVLIAGNFIVYPRNIAQGWDSSMAFYPYFQQREKAIDYLHKNGIDLSECASFFPNTYTLDEVDLSGDKSQFANFTGSEKYVLYSDVFNLSDSDLETLEGRYKVLLQLKSTTCQTIIYERLD